MIATIAVDKTRHAPAYRCLSGSNCRLAPHCTTQLRWTTDAANRERLMHLTMLHLQQLPHFCGCPCCWPAAVTVPHTAPSVAPSYLYCCRCCFCHKHFVVWLFFSVDLWWRRRWRHKGDRVHIGHLSVHALLPQTEDYITYDGSLTQPGCQETVTWIVINKPFYISNEHVSRHRCCCCCCCCWCCCWWCK